MRDVEVFSIIANPIPCSGVHAKITPLQLGCMKNRGIEDTVINTDATMKGEGQDIAGQLVTNKWNIKKKIIDCTGREIQQIFLACLKKQKFF